jgi:AhpC/TSA antioxidant enzyme
VQLHRAREEFEAAGVPLVLIGQATPRHAAQFRRKLGIELPVLADKDRSSYKAMGFKIGSFTDLMGPKSVGVGLARAVRSGGRVRQGRTIGHPAQLGGSLVVEPGGEIAFSHRSEDASDNASPRELLEAARAAA